jgi:hypothetical protein
VWITSECFDVTDHLLIRSGYEYRHTKRDMLAVVYGMIALNVPMQSLMIKQPNYHVLCNGTEISTMHSQQDFVYSSNYGEEMGVL